MLTLVATDGHRLALTSRELLDSYVRNDIILPRKAILELSRLLGETDQQVLVAIMPNQVRFDIDGITLITKVIDGKFPDFNRVVPTNYAKHIRLERSLLQNALQRAAILSNEKFRGVRWIISPDSLRILCTNTEQEEAEEELEITYSADVIDIGFNITYLLEVLGNVDTPEVDCWFGDANTSMLLTLPDRDDFKYVVMPMRI
jgi:DNA polymerase-3 subunit beta